MDSQKKKSFYKDTTFCVLDFETTGLSPKNDRVIEIGIVKIKNGKINEHFSSLINPGKFLPDFISNLTGITNDDLYDAPTFQDIALKVKSLLNDSVLVAHNLQFDYSFLLNEFKRCEVELPPLKTLCTVKLSRFVFPELKSRSLSTVLRHMKIKHKDVHRALGDAQATAKLLLKEFELVNKNDIKTIDDLIELIQPINNTHSTNLKYNLNKDLVTQNPGVYFFKNKFDKIIYVGKAKSLKNRIDNHLQESAPKHSQKIIKKAYSLEIEEKNSELTALLAEAEYIKKFKPELNHLLKKYPQSFFLKFDYTHHFPIPIKTNKFSFDESDYFGPFSRRDDVEILIDTINKSFELRECKENIFNKKTACYLKDIARCTAPCENFNKITYQSELEKVYDFLAGNNSFITKRLINKMKYFAEEKKYENAAEVRDTINIILKNINRLALIREPINKTNALIIINSSLKCDKILIKEGKVFIPGFDELSEKDFYKIAEEYYTQTIFNEKKIDEKDLERMRIILSWLIRNKTKSRIYYLKEYDDYQEFINSVLTQNKINNYTQ